MFGHCYKAILSRNAFEVKKKIIIMNSMYVTIPIEYSLESIMNIISKDICV